VRKRNSAVIYARVSRLEQEREGYSIPAQLKALHEYARQCGLRVLREFIDVESANDQNAPSRASCRAITGLATRHAPPRHLLRKYRFLATNPWKFENDAEEDRIIDSASCFSRVPENFSKSPDGRHEQARCSRACRTSSSNYFSLSTEFSNCSNSAWLAAIVLAGPVNLMNTFPPGPSTIAPRRR
jgi:Resolvase, N terminal domain